ncbi:MAG: OsmC family protein [Gaiellaceae bacterium]
MSGSRSAGGDLSSGGLDGSSKPSVAESRSTRYAVDGENRPGGGATISARTSTLAFEGSAATGEVLPGPADLLAAALAACILKNVERFSGLLPFRYERARVYVEVEREEPPPRIVPAHYTLRIVTDEPEHRVELLHRNVVRFGTVTNTLAAACEVSGTVVAEPRASGAEG